MTKEQISKEIKECEERLAKLREEMNKPEYGGRRWKPKAGDTYCCLPSDGNVAELHFDSEYDLDVYAHGNCFKTEEEARFEAERRKVIAELSDFAEGDEAVWDGNTGHWKIYYSFSEKKICYGRYFVMKEAVLYFPSAEAAKAAVEAVGEDRVKKYYLGIKED
ncbi:MAG: hypothetical protein IKR26_04395 [Lachnospiraceae bacterium]|nr:hypothetical protein [Lachnospiraceae bacterium]